MADWKNNPVRTFWLGVALASTTLAVILLTLLTPLKADTPPMPTSSPDSADVLAFPLQLAPGIDGLALIDRKNYAICIYQYQARRPAHERFSLVAARNFRYDCQLQQLNTDPPLEQVRQWLIRASQIEKERLDDKTPQQEPQPPEEPQSLEKEKALIESMSKDTKN